METPQEVDSPLEKGNEGHDLESEPKGESDPTNTKDQCNANDPTQILWEMGGKGISTIHLQRKRLSSRNFHLHGDQTLSSERIHESAFSFSNESIEQEAREEKLYSESKVSKGLNSSDHSCRSPRDWRKAPSSPAHNRLRGFRPGTQEIASVQPSLRAVSFRRNRPSVNAAWIQPKSGSLRNTWSSRSDTVLPITLITPDSPQSSPQLQDSDHSVDIIIKPPPRILHRKVNTPIVTTPFPIFGEKDHSEVCTPSPLINSRNQSISPFDRDSFNDSWLTNSPLPPYMSTSRLLGVSHDLSAEELNPPGSIHIKVPSSRRRRFSILPSLFPSYSNSFDSLVMYDTLVDTGDCPSSGSFPSYSCKQELDELDFSDLQNLSKQVPLTRSEEITEDVTDTITALMNEEKKDQLNRIWDGEELEGGKVSSEDDMIDGAYFGLPPHTSSNPVTITISPFTPESLPTDPESNPVSSTPMISREPTPIPLSPPPSPSSYETSSITPEEVPISPHANINVMELKIEDMLTFMHEPILDISSLSPLPSPPPPSPCTPPSPPSSCTPTPSSASPCTPPSPDLSPLPSLMVPEIEYQPTNMQVQYVQDYDTERMGRYRRKEEEERRKQEELRAEASHILDEWKKNRMKQVEADLKAREKRKSVSYRISEFVYLFGDCEMLLIPYILILDYIFGPILKPSDDLLHLDSCFISYIQDGVLDSSPFAERIGNNHPNTRELMILEIQRNRYLQSLFQSFSFYYQCSLNYTYKKLSYYL